MERMDVAAVSTAILLAACGGSGRAPTPTAPAPPAAPAAPVTASVSICEELMAPGSYTLVSDLPEKTICLRVEASHVAVDCAGHALGGIAVNDGLSDLSFQHCRSTGFAKSTDVSNLTISDNTLSNIILLENPRSVLIQHNRISTTARAGGVVGITGGSGNQILDNDIDGGYHGRDLAGQGSDGPGADDGIVLSRTSDALIRGNRIANVFDAGIEGTEELLHTTIADNTISDAIVAGVSSYWCTVWDGNVVRNNTVSHSLALLKVVAGDGAPCGAPAPVSFFMNDTTIADNRLIEPLTPARGDTFGILVLIAGGGNVLQGNDVGSYGVKVPFGAFTDAGGNVCGSQGNFTC